MSWLGARVARWAGVLFIATAWSSGIVAQERCEEPLEPAFQEHMSALPEAVAQEDFARVLELLEWPLETYEYAVLHYARARALHRLERWQDAEHAYSQFLRHYDGCPDPDGLDATARHYRNLVTAQIQASESPPAEPVTAGGGISPAWIPTGLGLAVLTFALVHEGTSLHLESDLEDARRNRDQGLYDQVLSEWQDQHNVAVVAWSAGGALLLAGSIWLVVDALDSDVETQAEVGWSPRPSGGVMVFGGRF